MNNTQIALFPSSIVVFNFTHDFADRLAQTVSAHPGMPVLFLNTIFDRSVFSQAENTLRTFIFSRDHISSDAVDSTYPAQWISGGDIIPALPGNIQVAATPTGFTVTSLPPLTQTLTFG